MSERLIPARILHVDDEQEVLDQVHDYLTREEIEGWGRPDVVGIRAFDDALATLEAQRFDLMILDVRLGGHADQDVPPEEEEGLRTLGAIKQRRFLPVVFWTGLPGKVEHLEGPLVRSVEKTAGLDVLLTTVRDLFSAGLPALNRALRRLVEDEQRRYMWDFVADHWDELRESGDEMALAYLLVRRLGRSLSGPAIQQLATELGEAGGRAPEEGKIHAAEMYIVPPLRDTNPGVADLYRGSGGETEGWWLIVTPSCDLEHDKAEWVIVAACESLAGDPRIQAWLANDNNQNRSSVRSLVGHSTGGQADRHLFLPAAPTIPALVADFQRLRAIGRADLDSMDRVASLASPFAEAMVSRFGRYFGRVGTDDLDVDAIMAGTRAAATTADPPEEETAPAAPSVEDEPPATDSKSQETPSS